MANNSVAKTTESPMKTLNHFLSQAKPKLAAVAAANLDPERLIKIVAVAASRNPKLLECTPLSIVTELMTAAQLGLEPVGPLGQAYLVPYYNNKVRAMEAQLQIGYRGLIALARRSGELSTIEAHVVHEKDDFSLVYGIDSKLEHKPYMGREDPGPVVAAYAVAKLKDGGTQHEVMTIRDLDKIQARSKSKGRDGKAFGPWASDYEEMCRKTVVKRLCKYLPLSTEFAHAVDVDNKATGIAGEDFLDAEISEATEHNPNDLSALQGDKDEGGLTLEGEVVEERMPGEEG